MQCIIMEKHSNQINTPLGLASKINKPAMALAAVCSKAVVLLFNVAPICLCFCLFGPWFVVQYLVLLVVLQSF